MTSSSTFPSTPPTRQRVLPIQLIALHVRIHQQQGQHIQLPLLFLSWYSRYARKNLNKSVTNPGKSFSSWFVLIFTRLRASCEKAIGCPFSQNLYICVPMRRTQKKHELREFSRSNLRFRSRNSWLKLRCGASCPAKAVMISSLIPCDGRWGIDQSAPHWGRHPS